MSQTMLRKLSLIVNSSVHGVLDAVIDLNSIKVVKQHAREIESAEKKLGGEIAVINGRVNSLQQEIKKAKGNIKEWNQKSDLLLSDDDVSNDTSALEFQTRVIKAETEITSMKAEIVDYQSNLETYKQTRASLKKKLAEMIATIRKLESTKRAAAAKNKAAKAINSAADALSNTSVDNLSVRINDDDIKATAKLAEALGSIDNGADADANLAEAMERLKVRKAKLQTKKS